MSQWTHPICEECWTQRNPHRVPVVMGNSEAERCCYCGGPTADGIYVRDDPALVIAHEDHTDG